MASVAIMAGGAVLNAVLNDDPKASLEEIKKALEGYQTAYAEYEKEVTKLLD